MATAAIVPPIYDAGLADRNIFMETERAYDMARELRRKDGLLVGVFRGRRGRHFAADCRAKRPRAGREAVVVTILCDSADKYLSERFWREG